MTEEDIGYIHAWNLYKQMKDTGIEPIVIDSGEMLRDPKIMLQRLCSSIGIVFEPKMLKWKAGPRKEDGIWSKYWYEQVHRSTGLVKKEEKINEVHGELSDLFELVYPYYERLNKHALKL